MVANPPTPLSPRRHACPILERVSKRHRSSAEYLSHRNILLRILDLAVFLGICALYAARVVENTTQLVGREYSKPFIWRGGRIFQRHVGNHTRVRCVELGNACWRKEYAASTTFGGGLVVPWPICRVHILRTKENFLSKTCSVLRVHRTHVESYLP